jgi:hypothetical protein
MNIGGITENKSTCKTREARGEYGDRSLELHKK